jgi:hypothetical protein
MRFDRRCGGAGPRRELRPCRAGSRRRRRAERAVLGHSGCDRRGSPGREGRLKAFDPVWSKALRTRLWLQHRTREYPIAPGPILPAYGRKNGPGETSFISPEAGRIHLRNSTSWASRRASSRAAAFRLRAGRFAVRAFDPWRHRAASCRTLTVTSVRQLAGSTDGGAARFLWLARSGGVVELSAL